MHKKLIEVINADVIRFFDLDETAVFDLKATQGEKYLRSLYEQTPEVAEAMMKSEDFWQWWTELWAQRDRELLACCHKKRYGFIFTFLLNEYRGKEQMKETRIVFNDNLWEFYEDIHYWKRVKFYPNAVMTSIAVERFERVFKTIF